MMDMQMSFVWSWKVTLWFDTWSTTRPGEFVLAFGGIVVMAILQEFLASKRVSMVLASSVRPEQAPLLGSSGRRSITSIKMMGEGVLYALQVICSYLLMLAVMTYNTGIFLGVVLGLFFGHLLFGRNRMLTVAAASGASDACCVD
mmetsp:Transcript_7806/g.25928  ORF Transcript_7806/g.25928 Transcript_7806/m.25928 type:complete len:145 (-) Transcript_7806:90-524(-)